MGFGMAAQRIAIYARYSSDLQKPTSIDDQILLCRELVTQHFPDGEIQCVHSDSALTGATLHRPGIMAVLKAARAGDIDVIVSEGLDRISRNLGDIARIHERLAHGKVSLFTAHEGAISALHVGFKGTMNQIFLSDMKDKVRRAHKARAVDGRAPAGRAYGYKVLRGVLDSKGEYVKGLREIDEGQAAIVRRIFEEYARGVGTRAIVRSLNDDGIPGPAGGKWTIQSVHGGAKRGGGILKNNIYRGWLLYNRTRKVTDPETGHSTYEVNPEKEWVWAKATALRIIDDATWNKVQERLGGVHPVPYVVRRLKQKTPAPPSDTPARVHALTGLVVCGWCGGKKALGNDSRYLCNTYRFYEKRCRNARGTKEPVLKEAAFRALHEAVGQVPDWPARLAVYFATEIDQAEQLQAEAAKLDHRISRLLDAVERGVQMQSSLERILQLEKRQREIKAIKPPPDIPADNDAVLDRFRVALAHMEAYFDDRKEIGPVRKMLDLVVKEIRLTPRKDAKKGEVVSVELMPAGWPEFYRGIFRSWPRLFKPKRAPGKKGTGRHRAAPSSRRGAVTGGGG